MAHPASRGCRLSGFVRSLFGHGVRILHSSTCVLFSDGGPARGAAYWSTRTRFFDTAEAAASRGLRVRDDGLGTRRLRPGVAKSPKEGSPHADLVGSSMPGVVVQSGQGASAADAGILQLCRPQRVDPEAAGESQVVDPAVAMTAASGAPPQRVESVLPARRSWLRRAAVLDEQPCVARS
jgi:hypothetical protein